MRIHDTFIAEEKGRYFIVYIVFDGEKYISFKSAEVIPAALTEASQHVHFDLTQS